MQNQIQARLYYLDAVRAFALILGIIFHASLSYMPIYIGWAVMDINTSEAIPSFVLISHSFRMALFFLVAGYFSHMALNKKGLKEFAQTRAVRLGIPLLIGWFILRPLLISGWVIGAESMRGDPNILNGLSAGFATLSELPTNFLIGTQLWFLYYLILISASVVLLRTLGDLHTKRKNTLLKIVDRAISWTCKAPWSLLIIALPTTTVLWFMQNWTIDTPDKSLVPNIPVFILYGGCFLFGWMLHRKTELIGAFASLSWSKFLICIVSIYATLTLSGFESNFAHPQFHAIKAAYMFSFAVMMWSLISICIGISKKLFSRPRKSIQYIADASYWLYLVHLPIVIYLQIAFAELPVHWAIKLISITVITIGLSLAVYHVCVRTTIIGAILSYKTKRIDARPRPQN